MTSGARRPARQSEEALWGSHDNSGEALTPRHVLLTGATGFVGSHAAEAFVRAGCRVRALIRSPSRAAVLGELPVERVPGSLEDEAALRAAVAGVDVVVHLAALTHARSAEEYAAANVAGTRRLLEAARRAGVRRLVYLSSLAASGPAIEQMLSTRRLLEQVFVIDGET